MTTKHTCTDTGRALPFGRKAPAGECPRCDELRAGADPTRFAGFDAKRLRAENDRQKDARRAALRARGLCICGAAKDHMHVCTAGEW
jgi:hypothetical protein